MGWFSSYLIVNKNSTLSNDEILTQYNNLWQVDLFLNHKKHDLKIRPLYHWKPSRVKAHIAISFASLLIVRHLEYRIKNFNIKNYPKVIRELLLKYTNINSV